MRTVVIGGGPAGLSCALALHDRGGEVVVLEREAVPGGKVRTLRIGDWQVETGPAAILDDAPATHALLDRLGLTTQIRSAGPLAQRRYLQQEGALVALPANPPAILSTPLLSWRGKLRLAAEPLTGPAPAGIDETIGAFARRHVGAEAVERLVRPMVNGIYAGDVERLSLASTFPRLLALVRQHGSLLSGALASERQRRQSGAPRARMMTLAGGLGRIPTAIATLLGERVRYGATVERLERLDRLECLDRTETTWRVHIPGQPALDAERLVLAVPEDVARRLIEPFDAPCGAVLAKIPSVPLVAVCLGYRTSAIPRPLDGVGFLVGTGEGSALLGVLWMSSIFPDGTQAPPGCSLLRGLIGGAHHATVCDLSDDALLHEMRVQLQHTLSLPMDSEPLFTHIVRWPQAIAQYEVGHARRLSTLRTRGGALNVHFVGQPYDGVGLNDVLRDGQALGRELARADRA